MTNRPEDQPTDNGQAENDQSANDQFANDDSTQINSADADATSVLPESNDEVHSDSGVPHAAEPGPNEQPAGPVGQPAAASAHGAPFPTYVPAQAQPAETPKTSFKERSRNLVRHRAAPIVAALLVGGLLGSGITAVATIGGNHRDESSQHFSGHDRGGRQGAGGTDRSGPGGNGKRPGNAGRGNRGQGNNDQGNNNPGNNNQGNNNQGNND